ncbi:MAG: metallophosphoesterase [Pirellulaceae bacterium]|nr:metallophosphoesterase [Pirellulaceae bacterium]
MFLFRIRLPFRWTRRRNNPILRGIRPTTQKRQRALRFEILEEKAVLATFAVIGDYGSSGANERAVADMVKAWNPQSILTLGDNNYENGSAATIDANIGQYYHDYIGNYQGGYGSGSPINRFLPVLGNHDWDTAGAQPYLDYFTLPGNERYYDFVLDNVHFFAVDSDPREPSGNSSTSVQGEWLRNGLANSQEAFNVVYFHNAPYTSDGGVGPTSIMRWPFREWGADAVLAGHAHQYERLNVDGLPYFVNGLGGAEIANFGATATGSQVRYNANFGAMRLITNSENLRFEFLSIAGEGTLVDSYTVYPNSTFNDRFVDATLLSGTSLSVVGSNLGATFETGEQYNIGSMGGKSVWWNWKAPSAGSVRVATAGSSFDTTLGIYTGSAVSSLTKVASNDDVSGSVRTSLLTFSAVAGKTYRISVDGYSGATGQIALQLSAAPPLVNDAFSSRTVLVGSSVTATGSNTTATSEPGEPANAGIVGGKSVWWSWTAPASGSVSISTSGSSFDTTLGVYSGSSVNALTAVASSDDESGSIRTSRVIFAAVAGRTYQISVDGYRAATGNVALSVALLAPPVNDNFLNRTVVSGASVTANGTNVSSTRETSEPNHAGVTGGRSVWWSWTAPTSGTITISTAGSNFDTTLGVYTGSSLTGLTSIASNDDETASLRTSRVRFSVVAGRTYQIAVDGYNGATGNIVLSIFY